MQKKIILMLKLISLHAECNEILLQIFKFFTNERIGTKN